MSRAPLMPKATAVWLIDNTGMTFRQIADFCKLHELEVKGIADGDVAQGIKGLDPIAAGELTRDEIEAAEADAGHTLKMAKPKTEIPVTKSRARARAIPRFRVVRTRPDAIAWLGSQPSRTARFSHHETGRHHQTNHQCHPRTYPLEFG